MAGLQTAMMPFLLLTLAPQPFFGQTRNCLPASMTAECGTPVDLPCGPTDLLHGKRITEMSVEPLCIPNEGEDCSLKGVGTNVSKNGRLQCFINELKVGLRLHRSKITDTGDYRFFINNEGYTDFYETYLQIIGTKKTPNISLTLDKKTIKCKVDGGCPVGHIQWSDNFGTNWTKSATVKEEDGLIVSTLPLSPSSTMKEYYCTVTYQLMEKTETKTSCISTETLTGCNGPESGKSEDPRDSETVISPVQIILPIAVLVCGIMFVIIWQRRRISQVMVFPGRRQALVDMNETELQELRTEKGFQSSMRCTK